MALKFVRMVSDSSKDLEEHLLESRPEIGRRVVAQHGKKRV